MAMACAARPGNSRASCASSSGEIAITLSRCDHVEVAKSRDKRPMTHLLFTVEFRSSGPHLKVLRAIAACRTAVLGGHVEQCDSCGQRAISYNSCLNRHCPKCQAAARQTWLAQRSAELLPVPYYHVVFTLPHVLAPLALQNKALVYGLLFRAAAETLLEI